MLDILVAEDNAVNQIVFTQILEGLPYRYEIADNGRKAFEVMKAKRPTIILMDVSMPEMNGMDLIHSLPRPSFHLVFQTAYSEYAVQAFEKNAIDYLLKPFNQDRFNQALEKCMKKSSNQIVQDLDHLRESFSEKNIYLSKVVVKRGTKNTLIDVDKVLYFRSENHYTYICTDNFEYIHNEPLKDIITKLNPAMFQQVHRNAILNLNCIKEVIEGDNMQAVMSNGQKLQVSRSHRKLVKDMVLKQ